MNQKGNLVFWEISELNVAKEELEKVEDFKDFVPRNDFRAAMLKALRKVTKGNDKLYRRFNDNNLTCHFGVFLEERTDTDISINKEMVIKLDKKNGNVTNLTMETDVFFQSVVQVYNSEKTSIDSNQFRLMVCKYILDKCVGIPMRQGGGIYYIDSAVSSLINPIRDLFKQYPEEMHLHTMPVYDNDETNQALEDVISGDIFSNINALIEEIDEAFKKSTITKRQLTGKRNAAEEIMKKIKTHEGNLRSKAEEIGKKLGNVMSALEVVTNKAEVVANLTPTAFLDALMSL